MDERDPGDEDDGDRREPEAQRRALAAVRDYQRALEELRRYLMRKFGDEKP